MINLKLIQLILFSIFFSYFIKQVKTKITTYVSVFNENNENNEGIYLNTRDGIILLEETEHEYFQNNLTMSVFQRVIQHYDTQKTTSFCAVASSCIVCNMLSIPRPTFYKKDSGYQYFTQDNIFSFQHNNNSDCHLDPDTVLQQGMTLQEAALLLHNQDPQHLQIDTYKAAHSSVEEFRSLVNHTLRSLTSSDLDAASNDHPDFNLGRSRYILVNYDRQGVGQSESMAGHFSPLGAYHAESDQVLIMDVARYKYPPVWVSVPQMFAAMNTRDPISETTRGYLVVGPAENEDPDRLFVQPSSSLESFLFRMVALIFCIAFFGGVASTLMCQVVVYMCYREVIPRIRKSGYSQSNEEMDF